MKGHSNYGPIILKLDIKILILGCYMLLWILGCYIDIKSWHFIEMAHLG